jgi:peptidoglycan-associated lipoprotein
MLIISMRLSGPASIACLAFALAGCARRTPIAIIPPPPAIATVAPDPAPAADESAAERERRLEAERARVEAILAEPVHFEFDRSDLTFAARMSLDAKRLVLETSPAIRIRIEGHADERGSSEYNLALAMRRAAAARRYLVQRDIDADRIEIVSFGEERPACQATGEECWRMNRRDEFVIAAR